MMLIDIDVWINNLFKNIDYIQALDLFIKGPINKKINQIIYDKIKLSYNILKYMRQQEEKIVNYIKAGNTIKVHIWNIDIDNTYIDGINIYRNNIVNKVNNLLTNPDLPYVANVFWRYWLLYQPLFMIPNYEFINWSDNNIPLLISSCEEYHGYISNYPSDRHYCDFAICYSFDTNRIYYLNFHTIYGSNYPNITKLFNDNQLKYLLDVSDTPKIDLIYLKDDINDENKDDVNNHFGMMIEKYYDNFAEITKTLNDNNYMICVYYISLKQYSIFFGDIDTELYYSFKYNHYIADIINQSYADLVISNN